MSQSRDVHEGPHQDGVLNGSYVDSSPWREMSQSHHAAAMQQPAHNNFGSFVLLPQDLLETIFSFTSLFDCLSLSATSLSFMEEMNRSHLKRQRQRLTLRQEGKSNDTSLLPTVRNHLETLGCVLPTSHPASDMALQLVEEMDRDADNDMPTVFDHEREEEGISERFHVAFDTQQRLLRAHRLYAILLSNAIRSDPRPWNGVVNEGALMVQLEQYIGDVLCAFHLMAHSVAELFEGSPNEKTWMESLLAEANSRDAVSSYRAWVYLHSTLLRTAPFTWQQQIQLGMTCPTASLVSSLDVARGSLLRPHEAFADRLGNHAKRVELWNALQRLEPFRTTLNDFGRLGPTFRGRDLIQSQTIFASSIIEVTREFASMSSNAYSNVNALSPFLQSWQSGEESVMSWLLFLHQKAGKARPLTVSPPLVTVKCNNMGNRE